MQAAAGPIRPVVFRFPDSAALWDDTSLPLAVTLQPLWSKTTEGDSSNTTTTTTTDDGSGSLHNVPWLSQIPKCLYCGAPHPTRRTHYHPSKQASSLSSLETFSKPSFLVCYLCGKVSSTLSEQQYAARREHEGDNKQYISSQGRGGFGAASSNKQQRNVDTTVVALPLRMLSSSSSGASSSSSSPAPQPLYEVPAMACPLLWFVVLDANATSSVYWRTVHDLLCSALIDNNENNNNNNNGIPSHVHLSLLLVSHTQVGIFQLDSPVPHVQYYNTTTTTAPELLLLERLFESPVPMDAGHLSHTKTTVRSLLDLGSQHRGGFTTAYDHVVEDTTASTTTNKPGLAVSWVVETLAQAILQLGRPMGGPRAIQDEYLSSSSSSKNTQFWYAGAQISILLGNPPLYHETSHSSLSSSSSSPRGVLGGQALSKPLVVAPPRYSGTISSSMESDWSLAALEKRYPGAGRQAIEYYAELGQRCTSASMAVDVFGIANDSSSPTSEDFGMVLLAGLKAGTTAVYPVPSARDALQSEWNANLPWKRAFGVELRLRLSPGFDVDTTSTTNHHHDNNDNNHDDSPLARCYSQGGLSGPGLAVEGEATLWNMPWCDSHTTVSVDLMVTAKQHVPYEVMVDHFGPVALQHVLQTCVAYTTIVTNSDDGCAYTVRRMRISSRSVAPLAHDTETVYDSLDPEATAVVLFHKLALASLQEGLAQIKPIAEEWLVALLVCAYQSAEEKEAALEEEQRSGLLPKHLHHDNDNDDDQEDQEAAGEKQPVFVASERLVDRDRGGSLSETDVLLGKGHLYLQNLPLMIYMFLLCHAFKSRNHHHPRGGGHDDDHHHHDDDHDALTLDDRWASLVQLSSMPPHSLTRCMATRLQLWNTHGTVPFVELIELRRTAIQWAVQECRSTSYNKEEKETKGSLVFLVDSPREIMIVNANLIVVSGGGDMMMIHSKKHKTIGKELQAAIDFCRSSYKTRPMLRQVWEESDVEGLQAFYELCCKEDAPISRSSNNSAAAAASAANFEAWRQTMAAQVEAQLLDNRKKK